MAQTTNEEGRGPYQRLIAARSGEVDPRHVEAWLLLEYPTLDGLSRVQLIQEIDIAMACAREAGAGQSEALSTSFGL